ncbi:MAG TPA: transcriptional repressor [Candidatus Pelagibacter bacterium]|jgi:Fur family iron response transcriptional regulator|nr:transcriptional repressor [Candidatus Pelagibacter bacterium]|tara:strand:- start:639 stop:1055 length:417 start_codon:yes stop_codon:yes gene_type:complete
MPSSIEYIEKLRKSNLRPTKQRIKICEVLFNADKTFHFTISDLAKMIEVNANQKISLATVYNTIHAFEKKGYLKEIAINSSQTYFDTNTSNHHHFFDEKEKELIDLENDGLDPINIKKNIPGKIIKSVEVLVKVDVDK